MRLKVLLALLLLCGLQQAAYPQASPYSNSVQKPQIFTATGQTGNTIPLNGLTASTSTVGSSFASGTITIAGTSLTTVTFSLLGSADNGVTFFALPITIVASPTTPGATTITATANGLYQVSLAGITHVKFQTSGTFTATSVSLTLSGSPNALVSRSSTGGGATTPATELVLVGTGVANGVGPGIPGVNYVIPSGTVANATHASTADNATTATTATSATTATTATALAAPPAVCTVTGQVPTGVDDQGNALGCFTPTGTGATIAATPQNRHLIQPNTGSVGNVAGPSTTATNAVDPIAQGKVNPDLFGTTNTGISAAQGTAICASGCDIEMSATSASNESVFTDVIVPKTHVTDKRFGQVADYFLDTGSPYSNPLNCMNDGQGNNGLTSCRPVNDTFAVAGIYSVTVGAASSHTVIPMIAYKISRGIMQAHNTNFQCTGVGDCGGHYWEFGVRSGAIQGADESNVREQSLMSELGAPAGVVVTGGANATTIVGNWTTNFGNLGDGHNLIDLSDLMDSGLMTATTSNAYPAANSVTVGAAHSSASVTTTLSSACNIAITPRIHPLTVTCAVGATFTGTGTGTSLVTSAVSGLISINTLITGTGVPTGTMIVTQVSGTTGGAGIYTTNNSTTAAASAITSGSTASLSATSTATLCIGDSKIPEQVNYTIVDATHLSMTMSYSHVAGIRLYQNGGCGGKFVIGNGSSTPTSGFTYTSYPVFGSLNTTSYDYGIAFEQNEQGQLQLAIPSNNPVPIVSSTRSGTTVTATMNAGTSLFNYNGLIIPSGTTASVSGSTDTTINTTGLTSFVVTGNTSVTYTQPSGTGSSSGTGGTLTLAGMNNYQIYCGAETIGIRNSTPLTPPPTNTGHPWGDGGVFVEPNNCTWTAADNIEQVNHYSQQFTNTEYATTAQTPATVPNLQISSAMGGLAFSGVAHITAIGGDAITSLAGYGGPSNNIGHVAYMGGDFYDRMFAFSSYPLNGRCFICIGGDPQDSSHTAHKSAFTTYPLAQLTASDNSVQLLLYDRVNKLLSFPNYASPRFTVQNNGGNNGQINFGAFFGLEALNLFDSGAGVRMGWGLNAGNFQNYVQNGVTITWNKGGDLQAFGTNELMRLDTNGNLTAPGKGQFASLATTIFTVATLPNPATIPQGTIEVVSDAAASNISGACVGGGTNYAVAVNTNVGWNCQPPTASVQLRIVGTTASIGGSALAAGACATGTATIAGGTTGHPVYVSASDGTLPGALGGGTGLFQVDAVTTNATTVTVEVCAAIAGTPAAKTYSVSTF